MSILRFDKAQVLALTAKLKPTDPVVLVGDHGVYIMSQAGPRDAKGSHVVVYAEGCNPDTDEDFYDAKREVFGADDGVDEIGTAREIERIASVAKKVLKIRLTASKIVVTA